MPKPCNADGSQQSPAMDADGMPLISGMDALGIPAVSSLELTMDVTFESPKTWIPTVDASFLPKVGQRFTTLGLGIKFYMDYAFAGGFDVRHSTMKRDREGGVTMRYMVCSREGVKGGGKRTVGKADDAGGDSHKQRRRRISNRVECNAKICFRKDHTGEFVVSIFVEDHSHSLCSEPSKVFMRGNRKLDVAQQAFISNCIKSNIGPSKGFRLCKEGAGSYANVGATNMEFHNFKRDLQAYIAGGDGEMIIKKFTQKREVCDGFVFDYHLDTENRLSRLFWADTISRSNYSLFGDVISFDATYGTNRYSLVFVPFTWVDNHKRCVTFAAGLLTREDSESYMWLLEKFKSGMGHSPRCVVTDQDPAMKVAIERVLPECRHRFCMWHIMTKVSEKSGVELARNEVFRRKLNGIVWSDKICVAEFEAQWQALMEEYRPVDNRWFCKLYEERSFWIPAFFMDLPMSGLLRTTSRSEAQNNVFGQFTRPHSSLVVFYVQFECVLEAQRHKQAKMNAECEAYLPEFKTPLPMERHVAQLFTITIFYELQREIVAGCFDCRVVGIHEEQGQIRYDIKGADNTDAQMEVLPTQYVVGRWCKQRNVGAYTTRGCHGDTGELGSNRLWAEINASAALVGNNSGRVSRMVQVLQELRGEFTSGDNSAGHVGGNMSAIEAFCGVSRPRSITIKAPAQAKNKGSGK
ncbi:protein FAR1-RELATED SEQUENCE 5-like [Ipomoea triloba]|uniref:protein FAR1-RELATED SEQUENCE 5-like n=1 Tax=Ipomoea triloba TaxID=35885 RepID=UPI00125D6AF9|nr:protein FAR1-RELATED SEQUENCE 5-like [Ipomoea triloba]